MWQGKQKRKKDKCSSQTSKTNCNDPVTTVTPLNERVAVKKLLKKNIEIRTNECNLYLYVHAITYMCIMFSYICQLYICQYSTAYRHKYYRWYLYLQIHFHTCIWILQMYVKLHPIIDESSSCCCCFWRHYTENLI